MKICVLLATLVATLGAQAIPPDTVVAKVEGKDVTAGEVQKILDNTPGFAGAFKRNPAVALEEYFLVRHLAAEAAKKNLDQQSPWKEQLEAAQAQVLVNAMVNNQRDGYPVTPEMMDEYYKRNQSRYQQAKIKVIFIKFKPTAPTGTSPDVVKAAAEALFSSSQRPEDKAKELAAELVKKIRNGADFVKMVAENSEDAESKAADGDFAVIKPSSSYPEDLKKAVFALRQGDVSDPVRQPTGFYIIRCEEKKAAPIDEVREPIIQDIRQAHLGEYIEDLRKRFTPKIEKPEFFQK